MLRTTYSHLNTVQKGSFAEAFAKMAFTLEGFSVYDTVYDDRGVDFVVCNASGHFFRVQVKATDVTANPFIYASKFSCTENFVFCAVRLTDGHSPLIYIAKGSDWERGNDCLKFNPAGGNAGPYYEVSFSLKHKASVASFQFESYIDGLR